MLTLTGEVRKVLSSGYTSRKTGEQITQAIVVIEPDNRRYTYEVHLSANQLKKGALQTWEALKGQVATIEATLYVNHQYGFHKFVAAGDAQPIKEKRNG